MKVLKFGGTSVGTVESLRNVKAIVEASERPTVVVVSALGGITDQLIATGRLAEKSENEEYLKRFAAIRERHNTVIDGVVRPEVIDVTRARVNAMLDELERIYLGVSLVNDLSERVLNRIVSYGERMSSLIVSGMIEGIKLCDSLDIFKTVSRHGKNALDNRATSDLVGQHLGDATRPGALTLLQGFIATDSNGDITNLGRGGSDYTAAIVAAELNADVLEIWTDVDGFLSADPRKISGTRLIDRMSFVEAMDLCNFGAKVVYPPTIYPVFHKNIPVYIKNTFNPAAPGTRISDRNESEQPQGGTVRGISSLPDTCLLSLTSNAATPQGDFHSRVMNSMARIGVDIFTVITPPDSNCPGNDFSFTVRNSETSRALDEIELEFAPEIDKGTVSVARPRTDLASIALVGENISEPCLLMTDIANLLKENGIETIAASVGRSGSHLVIVTPLADEQRALALIHARIFENPHSN